MTSPEHQSISDNELFQLVRSDFQITRKKIYLNNGSIAPLPLSTVKSITDFSLRYSEIGPDSQEFNSSLDNLKIEVRQRVADLINCRNDEIIFTQSTTEGINLVCYGIDWRKGDKILVRDPSNEHHSNYLPWVKISNEFSLKMDQFPFPKKLATGSQLISEFEETYHNNNYKMVTTSHVMYNNGSITPIKQIAECISKKSEDTLLIVDGAQSVGAQEVSVQSLKCDFLSFPGFKWICGPLGIGILYVAKHRMEEFTPIFVSSGSGEVIKIPKPTTKSKVTVYGNIVKFKEYPEKFHPTFRNYPGLAGLEASLRYILRIGMKNISHQNKKLYNILRDELVKNDKITIHEAEEEKYRSNLLSISLRRNGNDDISKLNQLLQKEGIIMAEREIAEKKILRMSPHFYNSEEEMIHTAKVVNSLIEKLS